VVLDIEHFVERERGLTFKQPVDVHLAGEGEFQTLLLQGFDKQLAGLQEQQQVLQSLGLITAADDVVADTKSLLSIGVVGFYDPETKQLVVRGAQITPYVREVLAHELTHALDDQYFDLNRPQLDTADDETSFGFTALVEGNARRIEDAYLSSLTSAEQDQAIQEQQDLLVGHPELFRLPFILLTIEQEPYEQGPVLVGALLDSGGQVRLDAAFAAPPTTSEQVLDPDKYLSGEGAVPLAAPAPDGALANQGVVGAFLWQQSLLDSLSDTQVNKAINGWGGDSYVTWLDASGRPCLRDSFVGDSPADTDALTAAITTWAGDHGATMGTAADGASTVTVCG
jgi:hypothetical protein